MPLVREVLAALRIPVVEVSGYEADDLIATLVKEAGRRACRSWSSPGTGTTSS